MVTPITASMLYDLVQCPTRSARDLFADPSDREQPSKFLQLLWEKGAAFERDVIEELGIEYTDLSGLPGDECETETDAAMERGDALIYQGRIAADDLLGQPDLLRRESDGYVPGDIKSGAGEEGGSDLQDGKPKRHYGVQLALYTDILERKERSASRQPFVWDIHGQNVPYDLDAPLGPRTPESMWEVYQEKLGEARAIIAKDLEPPPAMGSICKLCHWRTACANTAAQRDDLTLIPELGRSKRDVMIERVPSVKSLAEATLDSFKDGKKTVFPGIGMATLDKLQERARLLVAASPRPYLKHAVPFPEAEVELFFDIETDPFRDICYLHGFVRRHANDNASEEYVSFLADHPTPEEERRAFADAVAYIESSSPCALYFFSKYERTWWRKLQERHAGVVTSEGIESIFRPGLAVDLYYDVVHKSTVWPTNDHSLKTLAKHCGFEWRDVDPSGAGSIEWYHRWVECGDDAIRQRILEYNEDDCRAMRVLLDLLKELPVGAP